MTTDNGGSAFPAVGNKMPGHFEHHGMTLRDYFAGQALANPSVCAFDDEWPQKTAYGFADAMLAERKKGGPT